MRSLYRALSASAVALLLAAPLAPAAAHAAPQASVRAAYGSSTPSRVLAIPGTVNFRDTGGYITYDGERTRWGVLYRSETLSKLPPEGVTALGQLGLGSVIDLRTGLEVQADGLDRLPAGVTSVAQPVDDTNLFAFIGQIVRSKDPAYQQAQLGNGAAEARMIALYRGFVTNPANRAALGAAIRSVANSTKPIAFHCSAGKDRTGVLADTILRAVGVPATISEQDYLLSNQLRAASDKALRDQVKAGGYMQNPDLLIPLQEVRSPYLAAFRDQAVADYGSFGTFLTSGLGLDIPTLIKLRERMVD
ncbi:tyrosine-protein phosphatase [Streptomyces sp. NBC_00347]|uniref:tyrosine-protein phosphatase n=1 Tax=Streptomyces sp. NBC_00347 TaxID=2975721 RepID=UPI00224CC240|nr:tyrosine-protein phosphatase [Streptomyces sp. NBC_00347]MCX5129280.1 tyrosine-protein phosphatase [Streptomyces sp. NBC_00347]